MYSILHGQNLPLVLTIPGESASVVEPMVCTIPPKVDKVGTSSMEAPMVQALVAQPRSKAHDDNPTDDGPSLLSFAVVES
jgi:hypothetical protein